MSKPQRITSPHKPALNRSAPAKHALQRPLTPSGEVRIIGGQWKRSKLSVTASLGLRPTPDRVRETLFNWLGQDLSGMYCVDAFAGTGVLGFEAASRGAAHVLLVEQQAQVLAQLRTTATKLQANMVKVARGDGVRVLQTLSANSVDVVFLDPPFDAAGVATAALSAASRVVKDSGYIYLEAPKALTAEEAEALGLQLYRYGKAGMVHYHLLQRRPANEAVQLTP